MVFKPLALVLLVPVIVLSGALTAFILAPPFIGAAIGVMRVDAKLNALGADFTRIPRFPERSTIYANDGETVLATVFLDNREAVRLKNVSKAAQKAVLAIEDAGFYEHGALNWSSLLRALVQNARAGRVVQGGSTITQQLVKNTLGLDPYDLSFERKFQELALAIRVEEEYSKEEIFELYLNQVYLGNGVYGIGTASKFYFHKPASQLTLTEGAMLAGIIREPAEYDPFVHPTRTRVRRNEVLVRMGALGPDSPVRDLERTRRPREAHRPGFAQGSRQAALAAQPAVLRAVHDPPDPGQRRRRLRLARPQREGAPANAVRRRAEDHDHAGPAVAAVRAAVGGHALPGGSAHQRQGPSRHLDRVRGSSNGAIRTMISGKTFKEDNLDLAATPHPTGSAFKPFVLAAAFEQGVPPTQTYNSASPFCSPLWQDDDHCVSNAEGGSAGGAVDLWSATENSINVVFAQLILDIGPETVPPVASKMGVTAGAATGRFTRDRVRRGLTVGHGGGVRHLGERRHALFAVHRADDRARR